MWNELVASQGMKKMDIIGDVFVIMSQIGSCVKAYAQTIMDVKGMLYVIKTMLDVKKDANLQPLHRAHIIAGVHSMSVMFKGWIQMLNVAAQGCGVRGVCVK